MHFFEDEFQRTVQQWAATLPNMEEDKYNIVPLMQNFALSYQYIRETSNGLTKEHGQRRGVDDLFGLAFHRPGFKCDFACVSFHLLAYILSAATTSERRNDIVLCSWILILTHSRTQ
jgi:hypothetical protein